MPSELDAILASLRADASTNTYYRTEMKPSVDDSASFGFFMYDDNDGDAKTRHLDMLARRLMQTSCSVKPGVNDVLARRYPVLLRTDIRPGSDQLYGALFTKLSEEDDPDGYLYQQMLLLGDSAYQLTRCLDPDSRINALSLALDRFRTVHSPYIDKDPIRWVEYLCAYLAQSSGGDIPIHADNCIPIKAIRRRSPPSHSSSSYSPANRACDVCKLPLCGPSAADAMLHHMSIPLNPRGAVNVVEVSDSRQTRYQIHTRCYSRIVWTSRQNRRPCVIDPVNKSPLVHEKTIFLSPPPPPPPPKKKKKKKRDRAAISTTNIIPGERLRSRRRARLKF